MTFGVGLGNDWVVGGEGASPWCNFGVHIKGMHDAVLLVYVGIIVLCTLAIVGKLVWVSPNSHAFISFVIVLILGFLVLDRGYPITR